MQLARAHLLNVLHCPSVCLMIIDVCAMFVYTVQIVSLDKSIFLLFHIYDFVHNLCTCIVKIGDMYT